MKEIHIENRKVIEEKYTKGSRPPSKRGPNIDPSVRLKCFGLFVERTSDISDDKFFSDNRRGSGLNTIAYAIEKQFGQARNSLKSRLKLITAMVRMLITLTDEQLGDLKRALPQILKILQEKPETKKAKRVPIPGHPGLYTFTDVERNPKAEKKLLDKIMQDAEKIRREREWWNQ